jgi:hypothetical protein
MSALDVRLAALATRIGNYLRDSITPRIRTWVKLAADATQSTNVNQYQATSLTFTAAPNTTYIVELVGSFLSAATTTGIALALDIPSGTVFGQGIHQATTTQTLTGMEQVADAVAVQSSSGVRAAATQSPIFARWVVEIGATGGTVTLTYKTEVNASGVTLKKPTALGYLAI